ncbi:MAG TPA: SUMF1/EgtB/PvdO family nonheme iron enzyme [Thermoguttaceae bacterium]|nr:SUMF1/EgtB/PvdO family nonheme iron enzyme [Thermoguttaceae bacterium]
MPKIFISYRRQDSSYQTTTIYEFLASRFGRENVFMDVDTIPAGVDFRQYLHQAVGGCDVLLAVIGEQWLVDRQGSRRLDDARDFVRIELEAALQRHIRLIPVLVGDTTMPGPGDLPESIQDLAFRNALQVRPGRDLRSDMRRLIRELEAVTSQAEAARPAPAQAEARSREAPAPVPRRASPAASRARIEPPTVSRAGDAVQAGAVIANSIGMKMVLMPAGEFMMGSPDSDPAGRDDEKPQHLVRITRPFYLGIYPVTQAEYERVIGANPSHFQGDPNRPVETVSWSDAKKFCDKLSALPEEQAAGHLYRLPTEAEWEYACRAGSATRYSFGDPAGSLRGYAWWRANSGGTTHPVGKKKPNAWGLHDMHGNVYEWCADFYLHNYYSQSPPSDPSGPSFGVNHVLRGPSCGSVVGAPAVFRCAHRSDSFAPNTRGQTCGIRVARTLTP